MSKEEHGEESSRVYNLYESNKEFQDAVKILAASFEKSIERVLERIEKACGVFSEIGKQSIESITLYAEALNDSGVLQGIRPPVEIKKELKHEKNPMRIKQLNRELTESYRWYRRKRV